MATVLIIGGGGREHTLAWKLSRSPRVETVLVAPGNEGMRDVAEVCAAADVDAWSQLAREREVDLVVVGPEQPLVDGVADRLRAEGFAVFGPGAEAARIEGDKEWSKELMADAEVPTAQARCFRDVEPALERVRAMGGRCVVKATGLAAGKGVVVCDDVAEAESAVRGCLEGNAFGSAGHTVLVEERLEGPELSVFAVCDGERFAWFAPSRDHKRLSDGDVGPNTGGMGAYTPVTDATVALMRMVEEQVLEPTLVTLRERGLDYRGLLYVGLMLTADGPKVLEYNCRFGDPETQVVLPAYDGDLYLLLEGAATGNLPVQGELPRRGAAVGVVLASAGYPASSTKGVAIPGLDALEAGDIVYHAATRRGGDGWETNGGRVLCAVSCEEEFSRARARAHALAARLEFDGAQRRHDIAMQEE